MSQLFPEAFFNFFFFRGLYRAAQGFFFGQITLITNNPDRVGVGLGFRAAKSLLPFLRPAFFQPLKQLIFRNRFGFFHPSLQLFFGNGEGVFGSGFFGRFYGHTRFEDISKGRKKLLLAPELSNLFERCLSGLPGKNFVSQFKYVQKWQHFVAKANGEKQRMKIGILCYFIESTVAVVECFFQPPGGSDTQFLQLDQTQKAMIKFKERGLHIVIFTKGPLPGGDGGLRVQGMKEAEGLFWPPATVALSDRLIH